MFKVKHAMEVECASMRVAEIWNAAGGKAIFEINTRTHGDYDDRDYGAHVIGYISRQYLLRETHLEYSKQPGAAMCVYGQDKAGPDKLRGFYLVTEDPTAPGSVKYTLLAVDTEDEKIEEEVMGRKTYGMHFIKSYMTLVEGELK